MKNLRILLFTASIFIVAACEEDPNEILNRSEINTEYVIIDDIIHSYESTTNNETGKRSFVPGDSYDPAVYNLLDNNDSYALFVDLDRDEFRYYSSKTKLNSYLDRLKNGTSGQNNVISSVPVIIDDPANGGGSPGDDGGIGDDGGNDGGGDPGNGGGGGVITSGFPACSSGTTVIFAEHANGFGRQVTLSPSNGNGVMVEATNFLNFPSFSINVFGFPYVSSTENFNDILTALKICNGGTSGFTGTEVVLNEDANFSGLPIVFHTYSSSKVINNLKDYVRNQGFLGIGRTNWNDAVSSARVRRIN